jgi:hypothetical protein
LTAPWAARYGHTSVVDAAGAIYVIGGSGTYRGPYYQDVWVSTDGGARLAPGVVGGIGGTRGARGVSLVFQCLCAHAHLCL